MLEGLSVETLGAGGVIVAVLVALILWKILKLALKVALFAAIVVAIVVVIGGYAQGGGPKVPLPTPAG
jgi:hypothetical protein